jgi:hypothetical protein
VADAGPDQTGTTAVECISAIGTQVTLDGSGSSDPDGDSLTYSWAENGVEIATGVEPTVQLGIGSHTITLIVDDGNSGSTSDDITIDIVDTTPPDVTVTATPQVLGPANQEYHNVVLSVTAADACDPSVLTFLATAATSDADDAQEKGKGEGTSNGDGETKGDIRVTKPDESVIQSSNEEPEVTFDPVSDMLELRAVHSGNGDGRTYTITLTVTDAQGNESTPVVVEVKVEHDQLSEPDVTKSALTKPAFSDADVSTDGLAFGLDQNYPNPFNLQRP